MRAVTLLFAVCCVLTACGGQSSSRGNEARPLLAQDGTAVLFATGPIEKACRASGRSQSSRARCGCVQAVADMSLSAADQRRGASFFKDPHSAQEIRQSDNPRNERFWKRWSAFGDQAERLCV